MSSDVVSSLPEGDDEVFPASLGSVYRKDPHGELGSGGMGVVWRYVNDELDTYVAVKTLSNEQFREPIRRDQFRQELKAIERLRHQYIAAFRSLEIVNNRFFMIMEYVPGSTLNNLPAFHISPLPVDDAVRHVRELAEALGYAHRKRVIHRDVKPPNIMVQRSSIALLDFGLARLTPRDGESHPAIRGGGTPGYMSPEQIEGPHGDERSDVWAAGLVLFECLVGRKAFVGSPSDMMAATLAIDERPLEIPGHVPKRLRALIASSTRRDPAARPQSMDDVLRMLRATARPQTTITSPPVGPIRLPRIRGSFRQPHGLLPELETALRESSVLTLTGAPGTGKTRTALELANSISGRGGLCRDGAWFVPMPAEAGRCVLEEHIIEAIDGKGGTLTEALAGRTALIVLDGCERAPEPIREVVSRVLCDGACRGIRFIATARDALGVDDEHTHQLDGLSVDDADGAPAVELFLDRAGVSTPDDSTRLKIASICGRLGRVPLLILMAAARFKRMTLDELDEHLLEVVDVADFIESCLDGLSEDELELLRRLCVFRGGWSVADAQAICGAGDAGALGGTPVVSHLTRLAEASLVQRLEHDRRSRYDLFEAMREYLERRVNSGTLRRMRRKHLRRFAAIAKDASDNHRGPDQARWLRRLENDRANLRAALDFAAESGSPDQHAQLAKHLIFFWRTRGRLDEGITALEAALDRRGRDILAGHLLNGLGILHWLDGNLEAAHRVYADLEAFLPQLDARDFDPRSHIEDMRLLADVLTNSGMVENHAGRRASSRAKISRAIDVYRAQHDVSRVAIARVNLAVTELADGDLEATHRLLDLAFEAFPQMEDEQIVATAHRVRGEALLPTDRADAALELAQSLLVQRDGLRSRIETARTIELVVRACLDVAPAESLVIALGSAAALRTATRARSTWGAALDDVRHQLIDELGRQRFDRAHVIGQALSYDDAIAQALDIVRGGDD